MLSRFIRLSGRMAMSLISEWRTPQKLSGDLKYNWLITVDSWKELIALRNGLKSAGPQFLRPERSGAALPHRAPAEPCSRICRSKN